MQLEAHVAEPDARQPPLHDLQRGHLLGHEEHLLALPHGRGDEVRDRLALAGPGRALDDEVAAPPDRLDRQGLRRIGRDHVHQLLGRDQLVQRGRRVDRLGVAGKTLVAQQPTQQRMLAQRRVAAGPRLGVKVAVHQKLRKRKERQHRIIRQHLPTRHRRHRLADLLEVVGRAEFVVDRRDVRQVDAKLELELGLQR